MATPTLTTLKSMIDRVENVLSANVAGLNGKVTLVNVVADLKAKNANVGDVIQTKGYYAIGDNGHGTYQIVSSGTADDGFIIALNNGKFAQLLHNGTIYARQYGVKLDNATDDTVRLNAFWKKFGTAELVVDYGVALVTGQLNSPGMWNPSSNNGSRRLRFINATINYQGPAGKAVAQFYNHQKSLIDGFSVLKTSASCYVNFVGFWYSGFANFDVPKITFNKVTTDITDTLSTADSYTSVFDRGVTALETEFYGVGTTGGGNINSISFDNVQWQGNQIGSAQYSLKFYGTSFQNFAFKECDLSYASIANVYIDVAQSSIMRLNFDSCYFDSTIPLVANYDYKGAIINSQNSQYSNSQKVLVKTKNFLSSQFGGNYGHEAGTPKSGGLNLCKNGDFLYATLGGWEWVGNDTAGGGIGAPAHTFLTNANAINGNSLQVVFAETLQLWGINAIAVPMDGTYCVAFRLKKTAGNGTLQISFAPAAPSYDLTPFAIGEEVILTANAVKTQGGVMWAQLKCTTLATSPFTIEIMEVTMVPGINMGINLPLHPGAIVYPKSGTTVTRPTPYLVGQSYFDTTLNKPIFCKTISPVVWVDATGAAV